MTRAEGRLQTQWCVLNIIYIYIYIYIYLTPFRSFTNTINSGKTMEVGDGGGRWQRQRQLVYWLTTIAQRRGGRRTLRTHLYTFTVSTLITLMTIFIDYNICVWNITQYIIFIFNNNAYSVHCTYHCLFWTFVLKLQGKIKHNIIDIDRQSLYNTYRFMENDMIPIYHKRCCTRLRLGGGDEE